MSHDQMDLGDQGNTPAAVQDLARLWACRLLLNGRGYRALGTRRRERQDDRSALAASLPSQVGLRSVAVTVTDRHREPVSEARRYGVSS